MTFKSYHFSERAAQLLRGSLYRLSVCDALDFACEFFVESIYSFTPPVRLGIWLGCENKKLSYC